jgi:hypothetical protein
MLRLTAVSSYAVCVYIVAAGVDDGRTVVLCDVGCSAKHAKEAQQMCGRRPVSVLWLLDSISHFKPQALESYMLLNDE